MNKEVHSNQNRHWPSLFLTKIYASLSQPRKSLKKLLWQVRSPQHSRNLNSLHIQLKNFGHFITKTHITSVLLLRASVCNLVVTNYVIFLFIASMHLSNKRKLYLSKETLSSLICLISSNFKAQK